MYATASARESRDDVLLNAIRDIQLASIVISAAGSFLASHVPMTVSSDARRLRCHVARANPIWEQVGSGCPALAIFQGPHAYIHPGWFISVTPNDGAVPTWTYIAVHVHGRLTVVEDGTWLRAHLADLTSNNEAHRPEPWSLSDVPAAHMEALVEEIVGLELTIERMEGSWKMAQSLPDADRIAVAEALSRSDRPRETEVAIVMQQLLRKS